MMIGDTDTNAAMCGAMIGALHGTAPLPRQWYGKMENGERGRDWMIQHGEQLAQVDLQAL